MQNKQNPRNESLETSRQFPCQRCGALLKYKPGTQSLVCEYCQHQNVISVKFEPIKEYDLNEALTELAQVQSADIVEQANCKSCGAHFQFAESVFAGECPFCGADIVTQLQQRKPIQPKSILPFHIEINQAQEKFRQWLNGLWFAPNEVKKFTRDSTKLTGIYLPYWTYDSYTESSYIGSRGDTYYVPQRISYMKNKRMVTEVRQIPKIRWTSVRGRVSRFFDDVLIGASLSLPRQILDHLQPWDLQNLQPYDEKYISGFKSEFYQLELDEGFDRAKQVMDSIIRQDIAHHIGGDHQRIHQVTTRHSDTTYKHCLLPVWSAAFRYRNKTYRFVINGRTGQVQGERPYSVWKIAIAVIAGLLLLAGGISYFEMLNQGYQ